MRPKTHRISTVIALAALVAIASLPAFATRVRRLSLQDLRAQSQSVILGEVTGSSTRIGETGKMVWTDYQVKVLETLAGTDATGGTTTLSFAGGKAGGLDVGISDVPMLEQGKTYLFFLQKSDNKHYPTPTVGWGQGLFHMETATIDGAKKNIFISYEGQALQIRDGKLARGARVEVANGNVVNARQHDSEIPEPKRMGNPIILNADGTVAAAQIQRKSITATPQRTFATLDQVRDFVHGKLDAEQPRPRTRVQ
jgi:hypothetical protein